MSGVGARSRPADTVEGGFRALVDREYPGLVAAAAMIVGSIPIAEETVQDVLERTFARWDRVSELDRPGAWVRRAVLNQSISTVRRSTSERRALERVRSTDVSGDHGDEPAPEIWLAVGDLPSNQARAIALHYGADLALATVATEMDLSETAVKALLFRARNTLRELRTVQEMHP